MDIWRMKLTASHLLENLAADLYQDKSDCLHEILRNGLCACMPGGKWDPKLGDVEVQLVDNHPLAPRSKSLVVLDHGSGFTKPAIGLYCTVGRAVGDEGVGHSGAAQKRIGRFAAFALNRKCMDDRDISSGFYILTRTAHEGAVTMVSMVPKNIELNDGNITVETISESSTELGGLRGIQGSFTAIVVPNSVFDNYDQIRQALLWRLPRKRDLMYRVVVDGKKLTPPPLVSKVVVVQGDNAKGQAPVEAYLDRVKRGENDNSVMDQQVGVWFTDAATGIRVVSGRQLGHSRLPYPLWKPDLVGDIFVPNLLANQDTARTGLSSRYLQSAAWKRVIVYLIGQVVPKAKALFGDDDVFGQDAASRALLSFVERCNQIWGPAESVPGSGGVVLFEDKARLNKLQPKSSNGSSTTPKHKNGPGNGDERNSARPRLMRVRIGDQSFVLSKRLMDGRVFAEVDTMNGQVIHINDGEYVAMPSTSDARNEHILLMLLEAVAHAKYPGDFSSAKYYVAERRRDFLKSK